MDTIFIENYVLEGRHGHFKREHELPQRFRIDIKAYVQAPQAAASDRLHDAVDYRLLRDAARKVIQGSSINLVETIAEHIALLVLNDTRVASVCVVIRKLDVWKGNGVPGVEITRQNKKADLVL